MVDSQTKELDAFFSFFATFELNRPVTTIADLGDGAGLVEILSTIDVEYFRQPSRPSSQPSDNWVLRFGALKRAYRLMTQYFSDVLHQPTSGLEVPDLQAAAKDHNVASILLLCRLTIAIAVQCEKNKDFIEKIQSLSEIDQHYLMRAIEQVTAKINAVGGGRNEGQGSMTEDDHYYQIQSERSRILSEKETLEKVYQTLLEEHRTLQTNYDDAVSEKDEALARAREIQREADGRRNDKADVMMRAEIDRLRLDLQKSEDNLAQAESDLDKQASVVADLTERVDELQGKADEAAKLKDQLDEYKHAADRLAKTENVMEKYKKKLQEGADLRQHVKSLEKQNADLVDKNASLEEEYRKVAAFKPLMESYRGQIGDLENKAAARNKELDTLQFQLEQTKTKLRITEEERAQDSETLELYQERVRELELNSHRPVSSEKPGRRSLEEPRSGDATPTDTDTAVDEDEDEAGDHGLGGELDNALSGTTMTDLKLQVRKLKREIEDFKTNQLDSSRVLVLENLLDDANRMKTRYEADYLTSHREKLVLQSELEEIRSGKALGDGPEAAIALRQRLNETVDQLDILRLEHAELEVQHQTLQKELTIAKSDLNLVNKDQLDILASLRESVNEDKTGLEAEVQRLNGQIKELSEKNRMQLEQINGLLLEKVNLQSDGIGQREKMLQRERDFGELRSSMSGQGIPEDVRARVLKLHEDNVIVREQLKTAQDKLVKARAFIKSQDKLFKEEQAKLTGMSHNGAFGDAEGGDRSQYKMLEEELQRYKRLLSEAIQRYRKEQELMLGALHAQGMRAARDPLGLLKQQARAQPTSWLGQQRQNLGPSLRR